MLIKVTTGMLLFAAGILFGLVVAALAVVSGREDHEDKQ